MFPPGDLRIAYREHLAEFSHELTTRPGRPHIPSDVAECTGAIWFKRSLSGALAQLGERLICIQEVIGSIPIGSTNPPRPRLVAREMGR